LPLIFSRRTASPSEIFCKRIYFAHGQISAFSASDAKSSPHVRRIQTAARSAEQPRDWSDINGSGRGKTGTVG
jgi:hypothetical protein